MYNTHDIQVLFISNMTYIMLFTITHTTLGADIVVDRESHFLLEKQEVGRELC